MTGDPRRDLEEAGRRAAPPPDPEFADRLEVRLLAIAGTPSPAPAPAPRGPRRAAALRLRLALTGATLAVAAVVVLLVMGRPDASPQLALARPVNVQVTLSDGTHLEDPDGLSLPDGAVVTVGDGGFAVIGGTELHPGDVATITQGRLHVEHDRPDGVASATSPAAPRSTPRSTPKGSQGPDRTPKPTAERSPKPTPKPTPTPHRTPKPAATPTAPPPTPAPTPSSPPPTAEPTPSPSAPAVHLTQRPQLRAHANPAGNRVLVRWTATKRAASYLLIVTRSRVGAAADPEYPGSRVFRTFAKAPKHWIRFGVLDPVVEVRVMVVALGKHGHEVSRSRIAIVRTGGELTGGEQTPPGDPPPDPPPAAP